MKVIKLGGSLLDDAQRRATVLREIVGVWNGGEQVVLVHGGGKHIDAMLAKVGIAKRTHAGLRITDDITLAIVVAVLCGQVNKMLVAELSAAGVRAAGLSGSDGATVVAEKHPPIDGIDLMNVGRVTSVNPTLIRAMLNYGVLPVVATVALGPEGTLLNVNADSVASAVAVAMNASSLHFLTDVEGLLGADGKVIAAVSPAGVEELFSGGVVSGGMLPKLTSAVAAVEGGVGSVLIGGTVLRRPAAGEKGEVRAIA